MDTRAPSWGDMDACSESGPARARQWQAGLVWGLLRRLMVSHRAFVSRCLGLSGTVALGHSTTSLHPTDVFRCGLSDSPGPDRHRSGHIQCRNLSTLSHTCSFLSSCIHCTHTHTPLVRLCMFLPLCSSTQTPLLSWLSL